MYNITTVTNVAVYFRNITSQIWKKSLNAHYWCNDLIFRLILNIREAIFVLEYDRYNSIRFLDVTEQYKYAYLLNIL